MKKPSQILLVLLVLSVIGSLPVMADQCAWISQDQAARAAGKVKVGEIILKFCEPCGDREPAEHRVTSVRSRPVKDASAYWELVINDRPVDIAYVFVPSGSGTFRNLAGLAGCKTTGVSRVLDHSATSRDPARETPPREFLMQESKKPCGEDTCCKKRNWKARWEVLLKREPQGSSPIVDWLKPGEVVEALESKEEYDDVRMEVIYPHGRYGVGDVFYLLKNLGEGYYRVWYYGKVTDEEIYGTSVDNRRCNRPGKSCWARTSGSGPISVLWTKVRASDGSTSWALDPLRNFKVPFCAAAGSNNP